MPEDEFRLSVPPPVEDCYTSSGYLKKKCRYDKHLADLYKVLAPSHLTHMYCLV